jgi:hypothetical protein
MDSMKSAFALALLASLVGGAAQAQQKNACDQFKWSIERERGLFAAGANSAAAGDAIDPGVAYVVALQPSDKVAYRLPPERAAKPGSFGAILSLADIEKPGLYQITLSSEAWLDAIQGATAVKSSAFTGQKDCPGVRKSVRFDLKAGALIVQISNSASASIDVAIVPAP